MHLQAKHPGHEFSNTSKIPFKFFTQRNSPAPFGYDYYVSLPPAYDDDQSGSYPLILFLHGAGESQRGMNESYASLRHGVPKIILCYDAWKSSNTEGDASIRIPLAKRLREKFPNGGEMDESDSTDLSSAPVSKEVSQLVAENFITVTPSLNLDDGLGWNASVLSALLDEIIPAFRIDTTRIHVTGFSMGGYGTWNLGVQEPDRFASLLPICGGGDPILVRNIKHVPQWVHHGDLDEIVPVSASTKIVDALKKVEADDVKLTRYPDLAHDCWTVAYNNVEVWRWMLKHRLRTTRDTAR
ncbi:Alpha/Beta hydrolase protein [Dendryphion nanum]|uniref:Alpha/Beta hydrolase protein n=1 Tax=Dendryphion nanum TaxID=256645 RepID=A0A9P9IVT2_9PLEO|nr:Alpha/Beta hydrolase protein [Dendryphion nanum]